MAFNLHLSLKALTTLFCCKLRIFQSARCNVVSLESLTYSFSCSDAEAERYQNKAKSQIASINRTSKLSRSNINMTRHFKRRFRHVRSCRGRPFQCWQHAGQTNSEWIEGANALG